MTSLSAEQNLPVGFPAFLSDMPRIAAEAEETFSENDKPGQPGGLAGDPDPADDPEVEEESDDDDVEADEFEIKP